jgi:heme exporter protein CcmD
MSMDFAAPNAGFVIAAYLIVFCVLVGVVGHTVLQARALKQQLRAQNLSDPGQKDVM